MRRIKIITAVIPEMLHIAETVQASMMRPYNRVLTAELRGDKYL